jgi:hypothetical protein
MTKGFFDLQTPQDLLQKLRRDFGRLKESPVDSYAAFDFFVTAYHMLEWRYRDRNKPDERTQTYKKKENWFLPVCRQLANGAKHFQASGGSVKDTNVHDGAFDEAFDSHAFDVSELRVELDWEAAREFGPSIGVLKLAEKVLHFWEEHV